MGYDAAVSKTAPPQSVAITNVTIYDGAGGDGFLGDIIIEDGVIGAVTLSNSTHAANSAHAADSAHAVPLAKQIIDGTGLAATPGFIDAHTHDDFAAMTHPAMAFKNRGGVTTCIVGNCGFSAAPRDPRLTFASSMHPGHDIPEFDGFAGYVSHLEANPPGVNIGVLAGHGSIRAGVMGDAASEPERRPTASESAAMAKILTQALNAGALGLSSGLVYQPGKNATTDELAALAAVMAGTGALYASHIRDEGDRLVEAVAEAIEIGRRAGVAVQISHHKAAGSANWGKVAETLALIEQAQADGMTVHADQYPYTAGSTMLGSVLDNYSIVDDGLEDACGGQPEGPPVETDGATLTGSSLVVASAEGHPEWEGRSMGELAAGFDTTAAEAARRVLAGAPTSTVILHMMSEDDVQTVMRHPSTIIGSDGLPTIEGKPHPRLYNTFARVLGHYSRELGLLPLGEAVARMTGRSADIFGLTDRGYLRPGLAADIVVFDPDVIIDRGTFAEPNQHPDGIAHVLVNGIAVVSDGSPTGARPGRVLRRAS